MEQYLQSMYDNLAKSATNVDVSGFILCTVFSLFASAIVMIMYLGLYEKRDTGSGVHRSFLIIGPSVTIMFLAIQFSLPLSLGLLGALSFVRFRTPIKDPEEVSYLLLLIACSIASATYNFTLGAIALVTVFLALVVNKKFLTGSFFKKERRHMLFSFAGSEVSESSVSDVMQKNLREAKLKNVSRNADQANFHYTFVGSLAAGSEGGNYDNTYRELGKIAELASFNVVHDEGYV